MVSRGLGTTSRNDASPNVTNSNLVFQSNQEAHDSYRSIVETLGDDSL